MIRMLVILNRFDGCPTRKLLKKLGSNELHLLLSRAEARRYVRRVSQRPEGKGNHLMCNYLTAKGKELAIYAGKLLG